MGLAMAVPLVVPLPGWVWAGLLAADAAWLAGVLALRALRVRAGGPCEHWGHYVHHVFAAVVMAYMALAMGPEMRLLPSSTSAATMPGMSDAGGSGRLHLLLVGYFVAYTLRAGARMTRSWSALERSPAPDRAAVLASPELLNVRRVVMGTGMLYMLLAMA
jgi:hypothetical protein